MRTRPNQDVEFLKNMGLNRLVVGKIEQKDNFYKITTVIYSVHENRKLSWGNVFGEDLFELVNKMCWKFIYTKAEIDFKEPTLYREIWSFITTSNVDCEFQDFTISINEINYGYSCSDIIKPGTYKLKIEAKGYEKIEKYIVIEQIVDNFIIREELKAKKRLVKLNLNITPDICLLDNVDIKEEKYFFPGEYSIYIYKENYEIIKSSVMILPDDEPYILKGTILEKRK